jgi:hypothetical protein
MRLRLLQFDSTDFTWDVREGQSVAQLRAQLVSQHGEGHRRSLFFFNQVMLPDDFVFRSSHFKDDATIVVFDCLAYPEKSFPKVDNAFRFPLTRYDDLWMDLFPAEDSSQAQSTPTDQGTPGVPHPFSVNLDDLNAINRLRQTGLGFSTVVSAYFQAHGDEALALRILTPNA